MTILLIGGSGSGKSALAEKLVCALSDQTRVYLATMQVYDSESERRVWRHRAQRADKGFATLECPKDLARAAVPPDASVLLEDLGNLCANEMFAGGDVAGIFPAISQLARRCRHLIIVSNDVFCDGASYDASTQAYIKALADLNRQTAELADCVAEVVFSIPVVLKGELPCV